MPVISQNPKITYTASGTAKVFAFPFKLLKTSDLYVYVNSALVTTGYTVTGLNTDDGGELTFSVAPPAGAKVTLVRRLDIARTTDYVEGGALAASVLDSDFDRLVMMMQDIKADFPSSTELENTILTITNGIATTTANVAAAQAALNTVLQLTNTTSALVGKAGAVLQVNATENGYDLSMSAARPSFYGFKLSDDKSSLIVDSGRDTNFTASDYVSWFFYENLNFSLVNNNLVVTL